MLIISHTVSQNTSFSAGPPAYTYTEAPRQPDYQSIYTGPGPYPPPAPQPQDGYYQQPPGYAPVPTYAPAPAYAPVPAAFPPQQQVTNVSANKRVPARRIQSAAVNNKRIECRHYGASLSCI